MFYNVLKLKDLVSLDKDEKLDKDVLLENEGAVALTIALKKDEIIDLHESERDVLVYVYDGKAEFHFEAEKFEVDEGEILMFKKHDEHKVIALKDTKFLLVKI